MAVTRREFLMSGAAATGWLGLAGCTGRSAPEQAREAVAPVENAGPAMLRLLILGGTGFIGPHMVRYARARGHALTLFNRGRTNPNLFPDLEQLHGDRDGDLAALEGRTWDAVIDNSGYVPRIVRDSARLLHASGHYLFISTLSVYSRFDRPNADENHPLATLDDPSVEEVTDETYGALKALCEDEVRAAFADRCTIIRPGYIVGPGDRSDRWTYWPVRVARGGEMLAPGVPDDPIQIIDARDLAAWTVRLVEQRTGGTFNAVGPATPLTMGEMLDQARSTLASDATLTWVDASFLKKQGATVPIWEPGEGDTAGMHRFNGGRGWSNGLTLRPITETIADTVGWWESLGADRRSQMRAGLRVPPTLPDGPASMEAMLEAEAMLLGRWRGRRA